MIVIVCSKAKLFVRKDKEVRTKHRHSQAAQCFRSKDKKVRTKHRHSRGSLVFNVFEKAQASKAWYLLCLTRLSRAKHSIYIVFCKAQPSKVC